jgi:hypothetical protein
MQQEPTNQSRMQDFRPNLRGSAIEEAHEICTFTGKQSKPGNQILLLVMARACPKVASISLATIS